jgi:hypothetical protein
MLRAMIGWSVCVHVKPHLGPKTRFLLLPDSCRFADVGWPLWRENRSAVYNCCWPRQHSHSRVRVPWDSWPYFMVSDMRLPQPGGLYPPRTGWPSYTLRHWVPFLSHPTTLRATVVVFEPASTKATLMANPTVGPCPIALVWTARKTLHPQLLCQYLFAMEMCLSCNCLVMTASTHSIFLALSHHVLLAVTMKSTVFWAVLLYGPEEVRNFRGTYHIHLQGQRVSQARNQQKADIPSICWNFSELQCITTTTNVQLENTFHRFCDATEEKEM